MESRILGYLHRKGIKDLNPPQSLALEKGLLEGKSIVVASPTASGKTLIAEMAILSNSMLKGKKSLYIAPLRALASEKYGEFDYKELGLRTALSTGDFDSNDLWLSRFDVVIVTAEKMDSIMRHSPEWLKDVGLAVIDEIHILNDEARGPTLEIVITRLLEAGCQILGLSATIANASEIAEWLNAELVTSSYRPVKLYEGVFNGREVVFEGRKGFDMKGDVLDIVRDTLSKGKQALVFASTRKAAEGLAERLTDVTQGFSQSEGLEKVKNSVLGALGRPTVQCRRLSSCVAKGTAFHHAGLVNEQRKAIEDAFRGDLLKAIVATPTLAAGVNLPAYRVIITSLRRYYEGRGSSFIPVLEYKQMAGRAGRPKYDKEGESIVVYGDIDEAMERYVRGKEEEIYSKLSAEPTLRSQILALISTETVTDESSLMGFLSKTFFAFQSGDVYRLEERVLRITGRLEEQKFIRADVGLKPTLLGKRISQLYIDPETAYMFIKSLEGKRITPFGLLALVSSCKEMRPPGLGVRETTAMEEIIMEREDELLHCPDPGTYEYDFFVPAIKTASALEMWINEQSEDEIMERFGMAPGFLRAKVELADWLLYSCGELALLLRIKQLNEIRRLRERVNNGVKEELIPLVRLRQIGRVRARRLFTSGFTSIAELKKAPLQRLESIIGKEAAKTVKEQVGGEEGKTLEAKINTSEAN